MKATISELEEKQKTDGTDVQKTVLLLTNQLAALRKKFVDADPNRKNSYIENQVKDQVEKELKDIKVEHELLKKNLEESKKENSEMANKIKEVNELNETLKNE